MNDPQIVNILGQIAGVLILLASIVLWFRRRTPWLLLVLLAQLVSMGCRAVLTLSPSVYMELSVLHLLWAASACAFGVGLLCHALLETPVAPQDAGSSNLGSSNPKSSDRIS